ncbi:MAG: ATP synthase F1 subunit epsilon [Calditrichales bacterium]|nr:ATP synthase F1 subunit epsilon [Calditrichales bacterium]
MTSELELEIVTPFGKIYTGKIKSLTAPGASGQFQILKDHASMLSIINIGMIKINDLEDKTEILAASGGFCEVKDNHIKMIIESAETSQSIDTARAKSAKKRALERLGSDSKDIDIQRVEFALARALNRLKISQLI